MELSLPTCSIKKSDSPSSSFDINSEYKPPVYEEDDKYNALLSLRKGSERISVIALTPSSGLSEKPALLLHIAISKGDTEMVKYFLEKGANVSRIIGVDPVYIILCAYIFICGE